METLRQTSEEMKTCIKCGAEKAVDLFSKGRGACKECELARGRAYKASVYVPPPTRVCKVCVAAPASGTRSKYCDRCRKVVARDRGKEWAKANPEYVKANGINWAKQNPERRRQIRRETRARNAEYYNAQKKKWAAENPDKVADYCERNAHKRAERTRRRQAMQIERTPAWLTHDHIEQMAAIYAQRDAMTEATGVPHHVDHIVPLQGKNVSGLHCPWNLRVIPATENLSKNNRYTGPDSWAA